MTKEIFVGNDMTNTWAYYEVNGKVIRRKAKVSTIEWLNK